MTNPQLSRRSFLKVSAVTTVMAALSTSPLANGVTFAQSANQDLEILNYALTLEHLEARAYEVANGSGLLTGMAAQYFMDFYAHEAAHVVALTNTINSLGGTPVSAMANYNFPSFQTEREVLEYFQVVEELGAAAYLGQAPRLMNGDLLTAAVSIHNVEGQHAAILSDLIGVSPAPNFAAAKTMAEVLEVVTPILTTMPTQMPKTGRGRPGFSRRFWSRRSRGPF